MPRYALAIQYIGDNYSGSQLQPNKKTIQNELEKAISTLIKKKTKIILSGRTDKGVHAIAQVAHFDIPLGFKKLSIERFINSLNGILPSDISVCGLQEVSNTFHAQKSAKWRWYRYEITSRKQRSVWDGYSLLVRQELELERVNKALEYLIGEHDFSSFKASKTDNPAKICNVFYAKARKIQDKIIIDIAADRFLYNMIRIIVGTVLEIEKNSLAPEALKEILEAKDRKKAGPTASPHGLKLVKVAYTETFNPDDITNTIIMEKTIDENLFGKTS